MRIAYFTNQYPKVSHSFIRREILALEALGASVLRVAARGWNDPVVDPGDIAERDRTRYLLQRAGLPLLASLLRVFLAQPARVLRVARNALRLARLAPRPWPVHLVYLAQGPVLLIRAEPTRVLFGFWRGRRLRGIELRLKPGGKYEMATLELREGDRIAAATVRRLVREALRLDDSLGDPTRAASPRARKTGVRKT